VFADDGELLAPIDADAALDVAVRFMRESKGEIRLLGTVTKPDQWTVTEGRSLPLFRFRVADAAGTELYVSPRTAEVAILTTRSSRTLAWLGAIPHWFYFTALRVNQPLWYWSVVWASALGCVLAVLGLVLAFTQFRRTRPLQLSAAIPYRGWMRWHYVLGALFGVFALTWVFSGLLSMEPFGWTRAAGLDVPRDALAGGRIDLERFPPIDAAAWRAPLDGDVLKEIELARILDEPHFVARTAGAPQGLLIAADTMEVRDEPFAADLLVGRLRAAVPNARIADQTLLSAYDSYYYARNGEAPLPALRIKFDDPADTWVYVDPRRGDILGVTHRLRRLERWLFNGLHSLDFAFWYGRRPLWDIGLIVLSLGALGTSAIGMYLGFKRLRRDATRLFR
jgi:hypothetical protein